MFGRPSSASALKVWMYQEQRQPELSSFSGLWVLEPMTNSQQDDLYTRSSICKRIHCDAQRITHHETIVTNRHHERILHVGLAHAISASIEALDLQQGIASWIAEIRKY